MRIARLIAPRTLELYEEPVPEPAAGEVLLRIRAVGICGSDLHRFRGAAFGDEDNQGMVLGHEFAAAVVKNGPAVSRVAIGDRVAVEAAHHCGECEWCLRGNPNLCPQVRFCGMPGVEGALREYMVWPAHLLHKLPPNLDYEDGVLAEVFGVALHAVDLAHVRPAMTAAILGCGPIGLAVLHLLRRLTGVKAVWASDPILARREAALRMGADRVFDPTQEDVSAALHQETKGRGADLVFEAAGVPQTFEQMVEAAAPGGHVIVIGIPEDDRCAFAAGAARRKGLTFRFVRRSRMTYERVLALMEKGLVDGRSLITHRFSLDQVQEAFQLTDVYADGVLKAVIRI
ncbi:MAG: alcohol dehydrogenase catalytic domain-containing protein [candidate division KSB1 bacterium]|nr:alcohol dehydrogenase catalytic domain-containing protein [candidate division KSB1 bacterium]MDZ7346031.1 alcohol dehydrogenase catalytic domain-containing protein [candidate division KSB1 bacterium]